MGFHLGVRVSQSRTLFLCARGRSPLDDALCGTTRMSGIVWVDLELNSWISGDGSIAELDHYSTWHNAENFNLHAPPVNHGLK